MKLKAADLAIIYLVFMIFCYMVILSIPAPYPNCRDAWFHILVARAWYQGLNGMVSPVVMDFNLIPYPPLFHLFLMPFMGSLDTAVMASKVLQCLFYPLGLLFSMLLVKKYTDSTTGFSFGLLLTGTYYAFGMMQSRPQSFEVMLFPVAVWSLLENKTKTFIGSVAAMFYLHSPISIAMSCGLLYYAFRENKRDTKVWATALAAAPIVVYQVVFMLNPVILSRWVAAGDLGLATETQQFLSNPLFWLLNGLGISVIGLALIPLQASKWKELSALDKIMILSFLGFFVILPIWYMRVFQFAIIPLAYFTAKLTVAVKYPWVRKVMFAAVIVQAAWFTLNPVFWMVKPPYLEQYW